MTDLPISDDRLAAVLASVGDHLVVDVAGVAEPARAAPRRRSAGGWRRPLLVAAVGLLAVAGAVLAIAPAREAVADWLRIGRIRVELAPDADPAGLAVFTSDVTPIDPGSAEELIGRPLPDLGATSLGQPRDWWTVAEGGVLVGWADGRTSLWIVPTAGEDWVVKKAIASATDVRHLPDLGDGGAAVSGAHVLQLPGRRVAATDVVVWRDGDLTWRLEGDDVEALLPVAAALAG